MTRFADRDIMSKLFLLLLLISTLSATAQVVERPAAERYELAMDLYEEGRLNLVIDTLAPFFDVRSTRQSDILNLSAAAYKFLDEDELAKQQLLKLFDMNPFYRLDQSIPELRYLEDELIIYPKFTFRFKGGVYIFNRPLIYNKQQVEGIDVLSENYGLDSGDPIGTFAEFTYGKALWPKGPYLYSGLGFSRYSFRYTGEYGNVINPAGNTDQVTFSYHEKHWWFHVPMFVKWNFLIPGRSFREQIFIPYAYGGLSLDLMRKQNTEWSGITLAYESMANEPPNTYSDRQISSLRRSFNYSVLAGGGIQARSGYHVGFIEIGIAQALRNLQTGEDTDLAAEFERDFYYRGPDFGLSNVQITVGYSRFFFGASEKWELGSRFK